MLIVIPPCVDVIVEKLPCVSSSKLNKTALPAIGNASMTPKTTNDTTLRVSVSLIISFRNSFDLNVIIVIPRVMAGSDAEEVTRKPRAIFGTPQFILNLPAF